MDVRMDVRKLLCAGLVAVACVCLLDVGTAEARGRLFGRRGGSSTGYPVGAHMEYVETEESTAKLYDGKSLQEVAQERADAMAARELLTHNIHHYAPVMSYAAVGAAEGIGMASVDDPQACATCIVGSRVVADAWRRAVSGTVYRVRFFRN